MTQAETLVAIIKKAGALRFGEFTLKDGSRSDYFIDFGAICQPGDLDAIGRCYATKLWELGTDRFDAIFGLAYKGIPLATVTSLALWQKYRIHRPIVFNRKEIKDHGEGGVLVGFNPAGKRCVVVDDVFTRGSGKADAYTILKGAGAEIPFTLVGVDRSGDPEALEDFARQTGVPIHAIATATNLHRSKQ